MNQPAQPENRIADLRNVLLCVLLFLTAAAATNPTVEMGTNDDFSYGYMARAFAATGHITYCAWASAMLVPQLVWAAPFIKIFGFSFLVLRMSTVVLAVLLIPVLYALARKSGLAAPFATFATLLTMLSPLTMPESVSFMSDVPALLLFSVCLYSGVRAWEANSAQACVAWAFLIAAFGFLSGMDRQVYWVAPLSFLPVVAWVQRRRNGVVVWLAIVWAATFLAAILGVHWLRAQPYSLVEPWLKVFLNTSPPVLVVGALKLVVRMALTIALTLVPVFAAFVAPFFRSASRKVIALVACGALAVLIGSIYWPDLCAPWMGNTMTEYGAVPVHVIAVGLPPLVLGSAARVGITLAVLVFTATCGLGLWNLWKGRHSSPLSKRTPAPVLVLGLAYTAGWIPAVLFRSSSAATWDRYLMQFLPLAGIPLLWLYQERIRARVSRLSLCVLAVFALYGVAATHDAFAVAGARLQAAHALQQSGISGNAIMAGLEFDGWTQLETVGHLNQSMVVIPPGGYRPVSCFGPEPFRPWYQSMMTGQRARYFVSLSRLPHLADAPPGPVSFTTWLPPRRSQAFIYTLPQGQEVGCR